MKPDVGSKPPRVISAPELLSRSRERLANRPPAYWGWGTHFELGTVVLFVGESSAGKTVFLHNLAFHLAAGKTFLGYKPPRPQRVLHVDFESHDAVYDEHLSAIGTTPGWDFLNVDAVNIEGGQKFLDDLQALIVAGRYEVVIVDSLMEAYPVVDESDNAAAARQMLAFRRIARATGAGLIVTHNSGLRSAKRGERAKAEAKFLGRGATARVDKADVTLNYTEAGDTERLLTVVKTRRKGRGDKLRLKFSGDFGYEVVDGIGDDDTSAIEDGIDAILNTLSQQGPTTTMRLVERLEELDIPERTTKRALAEAKDQGLIDKPNKRAPWALVGDSGQRANGPTAVNTTLAHNETPLGRADGGVSAPPVSLLPRTDSGQVSGWPIAGPNVGPKKSGVVVPTGERYARWFHKDTSESL